MGRLWRRARRDHKLPDPARLAEARPLVGSDKMVLDPKARTVQLKKPGMKLDVGGIAKGYAAQAALDVLKKEGVTRALVGGAGDIVVGDPPPDARGWKIAIAPLEPGKAGPPRVLLLANAAVSTAGDAERLCGHRRPSLFPHHQSEHRSRGRRPCQRHGRRTRRRDGRRPRDDRLHPGPRARTEARRRHARCRRDLRPLDAGRDQDVRIVAVQAGSDWRPPD